MSDKNLSGLTEATTMATTDLFYAVIGGNSRKIPATAAFKFGTVAIGGATIGTNALAVTGDGVISGELTLSSGNIYLKNNTLGRGLFFGGSDDLYIGRDAANTLAQRNGTAAQVFNLYDTYASATDFHRVAVKTAKATLSGVTGASVTATNLIPDGAVVVGVTTKVTTGLGVTGGTTGYTVGDGTDVDRWGAITGTAAGTSSDNRDWTATTVQAFTAANNVVITATGGNFDATGVIYVSVQYLIGEVD